MKKKAAIILSGCGVYDGAELQESVLALYFLEKNGFVCSFFAPDIEQFHVINHATGKEMQEKRNVLTEAARIARGKISPLSAYCATDYDALCLPGGFGGAKNLSDFAFKGAECTVLPEFAAAAKQTIAAGVPILALCIMPAVIAQFSSGAKLTLGSSAANKEALDSMGAKGVISVSASEVVEDTEMKIVSVPCYMEDATVTELAEGIEAGVRALVALCSR
jgi:enhancing lycopene biosynthesis protein 2